MGNRLQKQDSATGTENYTYNAANMLLTRGGNSYTSDANGNTLTDGTRTNIWDSQNRLTHCANGAISSDFLYGADGLRRRATFSGTISEYGLDNSMLVREFKHAGNTINGALVNAATYLDRKSVV